jgi:sodium-coupled neutral amino acid transporter 9
VNNSELTGSASLIEDRPAITSPKFSHKDYNRYKYYSALRTGYKHLAPDEQSQTFLNPPVHVVDNNLFLLHNPFAQVGQEQGAKASSTVIVFSCWKTMMGSAVVSMPWAIQQSGLMLGLIICFTSFLISFYTCYLIVDMTGEDADFSDTARKYYGKFPSL